MMKNEKDMQKVLDALIEDSPYPIYREDTIEFVKNNFDKFTKQMQKDVKSLLKENPGGAALVTITKVNAERIGRPQRFFILEKECIDPAQHVYFMLHEFGHYVCHVKGCKCTKQTESMEEYHADKYALEQMIEMGWWSALGHAISHIKNHDIYYPLNSRNRYAVSARKLMKSDFWEDVMRAYFKSPEIFPSISHIDAIFISRGGDLPETMLFIREKVA
jgi:hypothetical protein